MPPSATPDGTAVEAQSAPFMAGLFETDAAGNIALLAGKCSRCAAYSFPRRDICATCGPGPEVEPANVSGTGRVYSSTVVRVPSPVGLKPPYAYGYVDMDGVALRVFALFARANGEGLAPGTSVRLIQEELYADPKGLSLTAHKFQPAGNGERAQ